MTSRKPDHSGKTRWVGLTRVSGMGQVTDGEGLETQADAIKKWVRQTGGKLVKIVADEGVSGTMEHLGERLALGEALNMIKEGAADGIVVYKLDRIGRDTFLQESVYYDLTKMGGTLASCDEGENDALVGGDDDPTRVLFRKILWAFAEYERGTIRLRCLNGRRRKMAAGGWGGGKIPYGWELGGSGKLVENAHEMSCIAQALTMRQMGCTYRQIAEFFAGAQVRLRSSNAWSVSMVKTLIDRHTARGYPQPARLTNLARAYAELPMDEHAV